MPKATVLPRGLPLKPFVNPYYTGPVSDHFDGKRFFNPGGEMPASLRQIWEWQRSGQRRKWPLAAPSPFAADIPPPEVTGEAARMVAVGHASFLLQTGGLNILFDPVWSDRCAPPIGPKRHNVPGIAFDDLPEIHVVCVSHSHYDHMDRPTLERLHDRHGPRFVVPLGCDALIRSFRKTAEVSAHDWHERVALSGDVALTLDPTHHWSARGIADRRMTLWASFAVETPAGLVYVVGDSGFHGGENYRAARLRYGAPKLAVLPIGAYAPRAVMRPQHQDPDEAVRAARFLQAEMSLGSHFGTFQLTDEALEDPVARLGAALARWDVSPARFLPAHPGRVHLLPHAIDAPLPAPLAPTAEAVAPTDHAALPTAITATATAK
ncbi:membrane protein [Aureimonas sp. SA4125]|uniref:MBL fold metallo-hydrolase n=1 Tax=Aureimonas sp. SA4125 TaxID=2826993 RepID=UPI001CC45E22|nr:MBL fold metallo-hydrolase [Aureimonas sp. SA4125]BDA86647.1 membrane protein [Aureimonas sp. SA4125]